MAIRLPLTVVKSQTFTNEDGTSSAVGGIAIPFVLPQDADNVVVKLTASTSGGGVSAVFQTTDDGGTTWYDIGRTSVVSRALVQSAQWLSIPVISAGIGTAVLQTTASVYTASIGNATSVAQQKMTGLPLLSPTARLFIILTGDHVAALGSSITAAVLANSQSATA